MQSNVLFRNDFDDYKDALQLFISGFFCCVLSAFYSYIVNYVYACLKREFYDRTRLFDCEWFSRSYIESA